MIGSPKFEAVDFRLCARSYLFALASDFVRVGVGSDRKWRRRSIFGGQGSSQGIANRPDN